MLRKAKGIKMKFTDEQKVELSKPLDRAHVKGREQGGRQVSYIEGWHAQAEANRIFGFDGWQMETLSCREVCRYPVKVGKTNPVDGWKVGYESHVRLNVGCVVRDGVGHGSGIAKDLFDAIESAAKEAETDAMKRAFKSFGNVFGLALYDKTQANVVDGAAEKAEQEAEQKRLDFIAAFQTEVLNCTTSVEIAALYSAKLADMKLLGFNKDSRQPIVDACAARKKEIIGGAAA